MSLAIRKLKQAGVLSIEQIAMALGLAVGEVENL